MVEEMIAFECPKCHRPIKAPAYTAGRKANCKGCKTTILIPDQRKESLTEWLDDAPEPEPSNAKATDRRKIAYYDEWRGDGVAKLPDGNDVFLSWRSGVSTPFLLVHLFWIGLLCLVVTMVVNESISIEAAVSVVDGSTLVLYAVMAFIIFQALSAMGQLFATITKTFEVNCEILEELKQIRKQRQ